MAEADCAMCAAMGYRSCDRCGNPVFPEALAECARLGLTEELCGYCIPAPVGGVRDTPKSAG